MFPSPTAITAAAGNGAAGTGALTRLGQSFQPLVDAHWLVVVTVVVLLVWLIALLVFLFTMIRRFTLRDPATWPGGVHPFAGETLAMPRGVFRAVLTVSLLVSVLFMEIVSLTQGGLEGYLEQLLLAFQMMLAFYFGGKVMHHLAAVDKYKEEARQETKQMDLQALAGEKPIPDADFAVESAEG